MEPQLDGINHSLFYIWSNKILTKSFDPMLPTLFYGHAFSEVLCYTGQIKRSKLSVCIGNVLFLEWIKGVFNPK